MLALLFSIGDVAYAVMCDRVREIVPMPELKPLPQAPPHFAGVFNYRGQIVPVVDLCKMVRGESCRARLSTRIILVEDPTAPASGRIFGLMAEQVTETLRMADRKALDPTVRLPDAPYLGGILTKDGNMIQFIDLDRLPKALGVLPDPDAALPARSGVAH